MLFKFLDGSEEYIAVTTPIVAVMEIRRSSLNPTQDVFLDTDGPLVNDTIPRTRCVLKRNSSGAFYYQEEE